jgi:hypothetical protein
VKPLTQTVAAATALALLAAPALATTWSAGATKPMQQMHHENAWFVNMSDASGTLVGVSPVAAKVQLENGNTKTFEISYGQYEKLKGMVGQYISFNVAHDVLSMRA